MEIDIKKVKIIVTIPIENTDEVRNAMCLAGAGIIGNYKYCSTSTRSLGTFIPTEDANPYIGKQDELEYIEEDKLEMICDIEKVKDVITALRSTHPYEEPAIDIMPLLDETIFFN